MRVSVIGSVQFTMTMIKTLLDAGVVVASVVTRDNGSRVHSDYADIPSLAAQYGIPHRAVSDINDQASVSFITASQPDLVFCLGWSQLISAAAIRALACPVIGYHPAMLPKNRGRHPIIWALVLGLEETGSTFFRIDEGVDSGDIVSQHRIAIAADDDAASLYGALERAAQQQILEICARVGAGNLEYQPQSLSEGNVWRKRSAADGRIDWRMGGRGICNLTRALRSPYPGATTLYRGVEYRVWAVRLGEVSHANLEPGRIIDVSHGGMHVKCGDGTIYVTEHDIVDPQAGRYLA